MYKLIISSFTVILFLIISSCATQKKNGNLNSLVDFDLITKQYYGGYSNESFMHIKNLKELKEVYQQINLTRKPSLPMPKIDFENESLIALFMGKQLSGGYSIEIDSINSNKNSLLEVYLKESVPEGISSSAITFPFSIYKLNVNSIDIDFKK